MYYVLFLLLNKLKITPWQSTKVYLTKPQSIEVVRTEERDEPVIRHRLHNPYLFCFASASVISDSSRSRPPLVDPKSWWLKQVAYAMYETDCNRSTLVYTVHAGLISQWWPNNSEDWAFKTVSAANLYRHHFSSPRHRQGAIRQAVDKQGFGSTRLGLKSTTTNWEAGRSAARPFCLFLGGAGGVGYRTFLGRD